MQRDDDILTFEEPVKHREETFDSREFEMLFRMQDHHFWYRGRHKFLMHSFNDWSGQLPNESVKISLLDLGGGCGGWISYCQTHISQLDSKYRLGSRLKYSVADSSRIALQYAKTALAGQAKLFQVDMLRLPKEWSNQWDVVFMLDVLEHIEDHQQVIKAVKSILAPGGLLFITTPALQLFWSYYDKADGHFRRYSRSDMANLAHDSGLMLLDCRYFMFLLSPIYYLDRKLKTLRAPVDREAKWQLAQKSHHLPNPTINKIMSAIFGLETPLGHDLHFSWGTSMLAVFKKI